ncbi:CDP-diacylglycerol--glycerol-3-phosphate 3-phosphatidyltransferase [Candidatus Woesearchaeota archaeon]|nr:CDP-diacylglycerol--glycerol-3-phosphate 3-phosphatidyltransferase [Candidatus Woesearchaeota archaeon]
MEDLFSIPNQISFIRILLIPIFVIFLLADIPYKDYFAAFIFIVLSLSDALDGYIARKKKQVTGIGKIIDPIADKLLISAALIFLVDRVQLWMAVIIIVRELVITAARIFFLPKKVVIGASKLGKIKTISQIVAILAVILDVRFNWLLMLIAVIITVVSGLDYIIKMGRLMGENLLNIPNLITTFRLLLIPLFIINFIKENINFALLVLAIIVLFDKLDGISARITNQITKLGRVYDVFTDFTLVVSSYVASYITERLNFFWIVVFAISSILIIVTRISYYSRVKEFPGTILGKTIIGLSYIGIIAAVIRFAYLQYIALLIAFLAYIYIIRGIYQLILIRRRKPKIF